MATKIYLTMESIGDQLAWNLDTEYKRELLEAPIKAHGSAAGGRTGELPTPPEFNDFKATVVLFSDINT